MGVEADQPGDELTEQEARDLEEWLARMTQAMAHERACLERRLLPPDPRLTKQLGQLCTIIADVIVKHDAMITEALTDTPTRQEMKQLVNALATLLVGIADDDAQRNA
jgi:transposase